MCYFIHPKTSSAVKMKVIIHVYIFFNLKLALQNINWEIWCWTNGQYEKDWLLLLLYTEVAIKTGNEKYRNQIDTHM